MATSERKLAIDQFRGLAILLMLPANYMEHILVVPAWLKHAPDIGLTIIDFIAPFFIFAIGLTFGGSVRRRLEKEGTQATIEHVIKRAMALVGIGMLFSIGENSAGFNPHGILWGTLQAIGVAITLTLPILWLPAMLRLSVAALLMGAYQWLLETTWLETVLASSHGGIQGSLSWAALLIIATVFADLQPKRRGYLALALSMLALGLLLSTIFPVSKHRMSISFDLVVSSVAALVFRGMELWEAKLGPIAFLITWGRNPLALYISHLVLLSVFLVPEARWWHVEASAGLALAQGIAFVGALHLWAVWLDRRRVYISL